jgi:hypothetical protein
VIAPYIHAAVVGTAFIKNILSDGNNNVYTTVRRTMTSLT